VERVEHEVRIGLGEERRQLGLGAGAPLDLALHGHRANWISLGRGARIDPTALPAEMTVYLVIEDRGS
jgi:hypothetical protein